MSSAANSPASAMTMPSDTETIMTRVFDAPRELVFRAYTEPELITQWWGPRKYATVVDKMDLRPGGAWRFLNRGADGVDFAFNGVYREIVPPERIVNTFEFEGVPGHICVETTVFEELDGAKTKMTNHTKFELAEDLNGMVSSGMESGWTESMERLTELLETLRT